MSLDFIIDYAPKDHISRTHNFRLTIHRETSNGGSVQIARWIGVETARDPVAREREARSMLDEVYGSRAPLEDLAKACLVVEEAAARCL